MSWKFWEKNKNSSSKQAYNRLQVVINSSGSDNQHMEELKREIFAVIGKYYDIDKHRPDVRYESKNGEDFLEINVPLEAK